MKTYYTSIVKSLSFTFILLFISVATVSANNNPASSPVNNLTVALVKNNITVNWNIANDVAIEYCEVQASTNGKDFTTIGFVMGANPAKTDNSFSFKQQQTKIKPGMVYFRVLNIGAGDKANASAIVKLDR